MLAQKPIGKYDQPIIYASKLLNKEKQNYTTIEKEALAMVYVCISLDTFCQETNLFFM